ncbi:MAG: glycosyltransferase [Rhizobiaceae bacterium]|nr:glycosyltransferase [Rhizobiaceae bacterium]
MGSGEYAFGANRRQTANQNRISNDYYSNAISTAMARDVVVRTKIPEKHIDPSIMHFQKFGIGLPILANATNVAQASGRPPAEELIRSGAITRSGFAHITAAHLGVEYSPDGPRPHLLAKHVHRLTDTPIQPLPAKPAGDFSNIATEFRGWQEKPGIYVACEPSAIAAINKLVMRPGIDKSQISLSTSKAIHKSQFVAKSDFHLKNAISGLASKHPEYSASRIITRPQIIGIVAIVAIGLAALAYLPAITMLAFHIVASVFYLSVTLMRAAMIVPGANIVEKPDLFSPRHLTPNRELPVYTIMVALYKEAGQVDELVHSLRKIDWPDDRLQVLLVCEEDDPDTIFKCLSHSQDERFQTVICPVSQPRTKPKALNFALPLAKGEFLVLYDAEDRPHRDQLKEAHDKFLLNNDVACLQAPLFIHNDRQSWITRIFAIEYTTLFGLILPVLERWNCPIPLGGTSNHFRTKVLREIGAWDPYNVTEDADLGIRLARSGYRCGTIRLPTMEEAPPVIHVWFKQRTRWIKGWLQTFLVHTRNPIKLTHDLGIRKMLFFHLIVTAIVISVLIHPFFIASTIYYGIMLARDTNLNSQAAIILGIDIFNLVGGYTTYFAVAWVTLKAKQREYLRISIIWIPVYWLLISLAGWRALFQMFHNPFLWEKTPHGLAPGKKNTR